MSGILEDLARFNEGRTRRISSYDRTGGNADYIKLDAGETVDIAAMAGAGVVKHIWVTLGSRDPMRYRNIILRMYWDGEKRPSVQAPIGDFFGLGWGEEYEVTSLPLCVAPRRALNCYFPMPFSDRARVTITNETGDHIDWFFYQIDFTLGDEVTDQDGRFHARFRRENPCPLGSDFTVMETEGARGVFMGCVLGVRPLTPGWWGEGEVKTYLDGDGEFPTICGTGTEDYIGSAWGLGVHTTPYQGAPLVTPEHTTLYRLHVPDPVYFQQRIRVDLQQMGAEMKDKLLPIYGDTLICASKNHPRRDPDDVFYLRSDDWCATAYWYQWPLAHSAEPFPDRHARSSHLFGESEGDGETAGL